MRYIAIAFTFALLIASVPAILNLIPAAVVHDEFAYLLQADTFARGRLTNPPHPHWQFFETMHVLNQPTYASKYPPGQGIALAIGQTLGDPIYGAILSVALACAATAWAIRGVASKRWAMLGGMLAVTHPFIFDWAQIYWGGGVAMIGSALCLGAAVRIIRRPTRVAAVMLAIGLLILANSRPFEGMIFAIVGAAIVAFHVRRRGVALPKVLVQTWPAALVIVAAAVCMSYYNVRVTGDFTRFPYTEYARQYGRAPMLYLQGPLAAKEYGNQELARFHNVDDFNEYASQTSVRGYFIAQCDKLNEIGRDVFLISPLLLPLCVAGSAVSLRGRAIGLLLLIVVAAGFALSPWYRPHYLGVVAPLPIALAILGLRAATAWRRPLGRTLVAIMLGGQFIAIGFTINRMMTNPRFAGESKAMLVNDLLRTPADYVVFVRYEGATQSVFEWVYNSADIDSQRVIFARDLGEDRNAELRAYYRNRTALRLTVKGMELNLERLP